MLTNNHQQKPMIPQSKNTIKKVCTSYQEILAAYVFGSRAKGGATAGSDLDLALLLEKDTEQEFDFLGFKVELEGVLDIEVDIGILNSAGEPIKHQVRRDGKVVFDRDPEKRKRFEIMSRKYYQDFLHLHKIYMQGLKRSLRNKYGG